MGASKTVHDILFSFFVKATPAEVFDVITQPERLNAWWPMASSGKPEAGATYEFDFGRGCVWAAEVTTCVPGTALGLRMTRADADWIDTLIVFDLVADGTGTRVEFAHRQWRNTNEHYRVSAYCWAGYLRLLCRYIEHGEILPYSERSAAHSDRSSQLASLFRVILPVTNIAESTRFYSELLGDEGDRVSNGRHYFRCGSAILAIYDANADGDGNAFRANPEHVYFAVTDLPAVFARAQELGGLHRGDGDGGLPMGEIATRPWGEVSFYMHDPSGNPLCFVDTRTTFRGAPRHRDADRIGTGHRRPSDHQDSETA